MILLLALLLAPQETTVLKPEEARKSLELPLFIDVPRESFTNGKRVVYLHIHENDGVERVLQLTLLGPVGGSI